MCLFRPSGPSGVKGTCLWSEMLGGSFSAEILGFRVFVGFLFETSCRKLSNTSNDLKPVDHTGPELFGVQVLNLLVLET